MLAPRGYRAIYNDYIRNKEYSPAIPEWKDNNPTETETHRVNGIGATAFGDNYQVMPANTRKGYITNIKKVLNRTQDTMTTNAEISSHLDWQTEFNNNKQKETNANKNDWDIIAEMGGTSPVRTDRVEFLGKQEFQINYQQLTQTSATTDQTTPLATTGSFSYTNTKGAIFMHKEFKQHGFIHILASVQIEKKYEESTPREILKNKVEDIYRPALKDLEIQTMLEKEITNNENSVDGRTVAYKPAWSEYKRLPDLCTGDMRTERLIIEGSTDNEKLPSVSHWHNFISKRSQTVIDTNYFNNNVETDITLIRNNAYTDDTELAPERVMQISEHSVTTAVPIERKQITGNDKVRER